MLYDTVPSVDDHAQGDVDAKHARAVSVDVVVVPGVDDAVDHVGAFPSPTT